MNTTSTAAMKFSVEVVILPVRDVDRALRFYVDGRAGARPAGRGGYHVSSAREPPPGALEPCHERAQTAARLANCGSRCP